jgi:hypothetical protein
MLFLIYRMRQCLLAPGYEITVEPRSNRLLCWSCADRSSSEELA